MSDLTENQKFPLLEWVLERFENCVRIAHEKESPADRDGWLEDAAYFREILAVLNDQGSVGLQPVDPDRESMRESMRKAVGHCDDTITSLCDRIERINNICHEPGMRIKEKLRDIEDLSGGFMKVPGAAVAENAKGSVPPCIRPPTGWICTPGAYHDGPCAAVETNDG